MSVTLINTTSDSFKFTGSTDHLHNPPQEINPGDRAVISYTPGTPSVMWYIHEGREGQIVVEVGNEWQGNKLWGEGAFRLRETGMVEEWNIVRD
ncbi:hypothetical protein TrVGV298_002153 [Trichoderma virens]|nr:hypothetical protein TrVGV298_002153 [Trichoderma virens]